MAGRTKRPELIIAPVAMQKTSSKARRFFRAGLSSINLPLNMKLSYRQSVVAASIFRRVLVLEAGWVYEGKNKVFLFMVDYSAGRD